MEHRVTSSESNVHIGFYDTIVELIHGDGFAAILVPRLGIMATGTMVFAPRAVERGAKSDAVDRGAVLDVEDAYHVTGGRHGR